MGTPTQEEHYKLVIEDARAIGERRERINDLFLGLITLILGGQAYLLVNTQDGDVRSTILIVAVSLFGLRLCGIWFKALQNYGTLLRFRYFVLKFWEEREFPLDQRYYISEDVLYDERFSEAYKPTTLNEGGNSSESAALAPIALAYSDNLKKTNKRIPNFINIYELLPQLGRLALFAIAVLRLAFFFIASIKLLGGLRIHV